jgi:hypothetical protein
VELVGSNGSAVRRFQGVTLFLKDTPPAARRCGGIGTWDRPAAQLGASFVNDGTLVVDPFRQRLWFRPGPIEPDASRVDVSAPRSHGTKPSRLAWLMARSRRVAIPLSRLGE